MINGLITNEVVLNLNDATNVLMKDLTLSDSKIQIVGAIETLELNKLKFTGS